MDPVTLFYSVLLLSTGTLVGAVAMFFRMDRKAGGITVDYAVKVSGRNPDAPSNVKPPYCNPSPPHRTNPDEASRVIGVHLALESVQVPMLEVRIGDPGVPKSFVYVGYTKDIAVAYEAVNDERYRNIATKITPKQVWQLPDGTLVSAKPVYELNNLDKRAPK